MAHFILTLLFQILNLLGWLLSIGICCACVYGPYSDGNKHVLSVGESAAYYGLMRTGWGVAVSWIIFSCATGYGGNGSKSHDSAIFMLVHTHTHTHTLVGVLLLVGSSSLVLLDMEVMILKVMTQQFYARTHTHWLGCCC